MNNLQIVFTGDIGFDRYMDKRWMDEGLISDEVLKFMHNSDHVIANVEGPLVDNMQNTATEGVLQLMHTMDPVAITVLKRMGADIWNLCNNHMMDAGQEGLAATLQAAKTAGVSTIGAGMNIDEASSILRLDEAGGIGIIAVGYRRGCKPASDTLGGCFMWNDVDRIRQRIAEIKLNNRWCVIVAHAGEEFTALPSPYTRDKYLEFLDMGADIIVAHHPHVPMNYELIGEGADRKAIFYSLGNFIFDTDYQRAQYNTEKGVLLRLSLNERDFAFDAMGIRIDRESETIKRGELPRIFTNVDAAQYDLLKALSARMFVAATKRQQIYLNKAMTEYDSSQWDEHFANPVRSGRVEGEALDFQIICPLADTEDEDVWSKSSLKDVVGYIVEQMYDIDYSKALAVRGDHDRLLKVMERADRGENITIAFLGGSITEGSVASDDKSCYAYLTYSWWCNTFPDAKINYVNAGIGGTPSLLGVGRCNEDILDYEPDVVYIEFSVNDVDLPNVGEIYEGLLRKVLYSKSNPAVVVINNGFYNDGRTVQDVHNKLASYYGIPAISIVDTLVACTLDGRIPIRDITPDDLHPNDRGHILLAGVIRYVQDKIYNEYLDKRIDLTLQNSVLSERTGKCSLNCDCNAKAPDISTYRNPNDADTDCPAHMLPALTCNSYETLQRYNSINSNPVLNGFRVDERPIEAVKIWERGGYLAEHTGDSIEYNINASTICVSFKRSLIKPAPIAKVFLDGAEVAILDANFYEDWGNKLEIVPILEGNKSDSADRPSHNIKVEIVDAPEGCVPFYLVAVYGN
ncbi:MAG: CapA family protein [Lachnospiraceae bacterium]|nr:CapA family protein [Lachnospiraceae bacterium]